MMNEFREKFIEEYLSDVIRTLEEIKEKNADFFDKLATIFLEARADNRKIFFCGNGGSASTASHFTSDLAKARLSRACPGSRFFHLPTISRRCWPGVMIHATRTFSWSS